MGKCSFQVINEDVFITHPDWSKVAVLSFRDDYYSELSRVTWSRKGDYIYSNSLKEYLHRYIMKKWYGEDLVKEFTENGFVVDHINNNGFDCRISNLEFLTSDENKGKGFVIDKEIDSIRNKMALSMFKDFDTGFYQLTLGFNIHVAEYKDGYLYPITAIKLLYKTDYKQVLADAWKIILDFNINGVITPTKLSFSDKKIDYSIMLVPQKHEEGATFITRDDVTYMVINEHCRIHSIPYDKGWK